MSSTPANAQRDTYAGRAEGIFSIIATSGESLSRNTRGSYSSTPSSARAAQKGAHLARHMAHRRLKDAFYPLTTITRTAAL